MQLKGFYFTAIFKSISLSADTLGITQPGVTRQLRESQNTLGKSFFFRKGGEMKLTHDGKQLFKVVKELLKQMDHIYESHVNIGADNQKKHIVVSQGALNYLLPQAINKHTKKPPDIELKLDPSDTDGLFTKYFGTVAKYPTWGLSRNTQPAQFSPSSHR